MLITEPCQRCRLNTSPHEHHRTDCRVRLQKIFSLTVDTLTLFVCRLLHRNIKKFMSRFSSFGTDNHSGTVLTHRFLMHHPHAMPRQVPQQPDKKECLTLAVILPPSARYSTAVSSPPLSWSGVKLCHITTLYNHRAVHCLHLQFHFTCSPLIRMPAAAQACSSSATLRSLASGASGTTLIATACDIGVIAGNRS